MKIALLMGNRFSPWHLEPFKRLPGDHALVCFRAESEIQRHFQQRDDGRLDLPVERVYFDYQAGPLPMRLWNLLTMRYAGREPRLLPFHERLRGFDLIQTWELFTDWTREALTARERFGTPVSIMVWDNIPFNMEQTPERRAIKQRALAEADQFLVYTERSRRMLLLEGAPAEKIVQIPPGIDTELFSPAPRDRAALGLPEDAFVMLFVGWLLPRKGIDFLLFALRELLDDPDLRDKKIHLAIVGSGPGRDRVDALIKRLNVGHACTFIGPTPYGQMPAIFRAADVFALPSIATPEWQEQFAMSLIEAMACGIPCIATHSGAIPEILGDAGVLIQPNDFFSVTAAVKEMIEKPALRTSLSHTAQTRAAMCFAIEAQTEGLQMSYATLITHE
ncbi:MAG TPA: glycosyltransferase [Candidatus Hydrogenedentes bacterium]|nr:glycosyltransferase [Candidatus Hydrogenedentota bacterium]